MDITRANDELDWEPRYSITEGLSDYISGVRAQGTAA
jgi:nucleoside-diphosphate-sugar epimerase